MGEKAKGKSSNNDKKAKTVKTGNRPHEVRAREALNNKPPA